MGIAIHSFTDNVVYLTSAFDPFTSDTAVKAINL